MSRRTPSRDEKRAQFRPKNGVVPTRVTDLPHLADAARRSGRANRVVRVDAPAPQQVHTPNRRAGQWLGSGRLLKPTPPQYLSPAEIHDIEQDAIWEGGTNR